MMNNHEAADNVRLERMRIERTGKKFPIVLLSLILVAMYFRLGHSTDTLTRFAKQYSPAAGSGNTSMASK
jgi:hypothetical protein